MSMLAELFSNAPVGSGSNSNYDYPSASPAPYENRRELRSGPATTPFIPGNSGMPHQSHNQYQAPMSLQAPSCTIPHPNNAEESTGTQSHPNADPTASALICINLLEGISKMQETLSQQLTTQAATIAELSQKLDTLTTKLDEMSGAPSQKRKKPDETSPALLMIKHGFFATKNVEDIPKDEYRIIQTKVRNVRNTMKQKLRSNQWKNEEEGRVALFGPVPPEYLETATKLGKIMMYGADLEKCREKTLDDKYWNNLPPEWTTENDERWNEVKFYLKRRSEYERRELETPPAKIAWL